MKLEKVKNYNHKLLAVLGTIVLLIAIVGLISVVFFAVVEISRSLRYSYQEDGILSDERIQKLQTEDKRQQVISYDSPILLDTAELIYMIPVSHKTLSEPETKRETSALLDLSNGYRSERRFTSQYYGSFNNLLIYDLKNNRIVQLFDNRASFGEIATKIVEDDILILFTVANQDTYKDGIINSNDLKSLCLYSLRDKKLKKAGVPNTDVFQYNFVPNKNDIILRVGIDHNSDGRYDDYNEPTILKKYNYKSEKLTDIVNEKDREHLQNILEGSKINPN